MLQHCQDCHFLDWEFCTRAWLEGGGGSSTSVFVLYPSKTPQTPDVNPKELQTQRKSFSWAHLPNHNCIVVETLHEEFYGTGGQDPVIPQEQGQEANAYVLKLPGPGKRSNIQNRA